MLLYMPFPLHHLLAWHLDSHIQWSNVGWFADVKRWHGTMLHKMFWDYEGRFPLHFTEATVKPVVLPSPPFCGQKDDLFYSAQSLYIIWPLSTHGFNFTSFCCKVYWLVFEIMTRKKFMLKYSQRIVLFILQSFNSSLEDLKSKVSPMQQTDEDEGEGKLFESMCWLWSSLVVECGFSEMNWH